MAGRPAPRPVDKIRSIYLPPRVYDRIAAYADENGMSVSEAIREFMDAFASGKAKPDRNRSTRRVTIWMAEEDYRKFTVARREAGQKHGYPGPVSIAAAIEQAMGEDA